MRQEDAFEQALESRRSGADSDAHAGGSDEIDSDIALANELRQASRTVPLRDGSEQRAWLRLQGVLEDKRQFRRRRSDRGFAGLRGWLARGATAMAVVGLLALPGVLFWAAEDGLMGASSAEAAVEGVVVASAGETLTLETEQGLQTVSIQASAEITDDRGSSLKSAQLTPGQLLEVRGKRLKDGAVAASKVRWRSLTPLREWCGAHPVLCARAQPRLEALATECRQDHQACARLNSYLQELKSGAIDVPKPLADLVGRCQKAERVACNEVRRLCRVQPQFCAGIRDRLGVPID